MELTDIKTIRYIQKKYRFAFKKGLGQNFLCDSAVIDKIVAASGADSDTGVLEIGPGIGVLTKGLCAVAKKVVAVEIDKNLLAILDETLIGADNLTVINEDILKLDLKDLVTSHFSDCKKICIAANLPYYITTPILTGILESDVFVDNMVLMVQKEVAARICASPGNKDYGSLTVLCNYYADTEIIDIVPAASFIPAPKVDSAVIRLKMLKEKRVSPKSERAFFKTVRAAFGQRRKKLVNSLANSRSFQKSKDEIGSIVNKMGLDDNIRAEQLSIEQFSRLSDLLME